MAKYVDSVGLSRAFELIKNYINDHGSVPDPLSVSSITATNDLSAYLVHLLDAAENANVRVDINTSNEGGIQLIFKDSSGANVFRLYFSEYGNLARQQWDSTSGTWVDSAGSASADYYLILQHRNASDANKVLATADSAAGKPGWRSLNMRDLHACGMTKTAGDSIAITNFWVNGTLTNGKKSAYFTIPLGIGLYGISRATITGTFTARQNDLYLFGSTSTTPRNFNTLTTSLAVRAGGSINLTMTSSTAQASAINNNPIALCINSGTITFS